MSVIGDFFKSVWKGVRRLLPTKEIEKQLKIKTVISGTMQNGIMLWSQMYSNTPPWVKGKVKGLNLPATISSEFARLILIEWEFEVTGSPMAEYINEQMKQILKRKNLLKYVEWWVALGGIAFKPYMREDGTIGIDIQQADDFYPVAFDSNGEVSAAVFVESLKKGEYLYTRLEYHQMLNDDYVVINKAFRSNEIDNVSDDDMGQVRNRYEKEHSLTNPRNVEALGNKVLLEKRINIRASDYRFADKKKYYVGFENSRKQKKEGTRIKELTDLAMNAADFTESDIVQRNTKMIFDFVEFMNNNGLLSED